MNDLLYGYVSLVLQAAQAHNVAIPGGRKYQVPSGNVTLEDPINAISAIRTSYSLNAISGADNFHDGSATIRDILDSVVETTRNVSSTCELPIIYLHPLV